MSGSGKTTVTARLVARGYKAIDMDDGWCDQQPDGSQRWREAALEALLSEEDAEVLFVAGCEANMTRFLARFDMVVLLSAPAETLLQRLDARTNNPYGKTADERARISSDIRHVEPLLRQAAHHEVVTTVPVEDVVEVILGLLNQT